MKSFFTDRREAAAAIRDGSDAEAEAHINSWSDTLKDKRFAVAADRRRVPSQKSNLKVQILNKVFRSQRMVCLSSFQVLRANELKVTC